MDMSTAFTITPESVKSDQQQMITICEQHGISRKALADALCVCYNYVNQVMSQANAIRFTTEQDLMLRSICAELGRFEFVERLLISGGAFVSRTPNVPTNDDTTDEILDGLRALGDTSKLSLKDDRRAVRHFGEQVRDVGLRLIKESMGDDVPASLLMKDAPLFDGVSA